MSDEPNPPSFVQHIKPALVFASCALLAPFAILASAYIEFRIAGTHRIEDGCRVMHIYEPLKWLADTMRGGPPP
jgi:hypothetical protein